MTLWIIYISFVVLVVNPVGASIPTTQFVQLASDARDESECLELANEVVKDKLFPPKVSIKCVKGYLI